MKLADCIVAWNPNELQYSEVWRGKARIFGHGVSAYELKPFACIAGLKHSEANDPRESVRQAYALKLAFLMSERDGLDLHTVHELMLIIDEYKSGCAEDLFTESST